MPGKGLLDSTQWTDQYSEQWEHPKTFKFEWNLELPT